ncbi:hypothetical protein [Soonwooa sp.]|uniref:BatD family protein n=1 Tax=Soonwooa sp. TaxID=1938592 RepID=UPI0035AF7E9B
MKYFKFSYITILAFLSQILFGQTLSSNLSNTTLALGEVGEYKLKIDNLQGKEVVVAPKNELLPFHFEVVSDSISKQQNEYFRVVKFQIFDEGTFKIPALDIKIGDQIQKTIPYEIEVINTAKKDDVINDIMKNKQVDLGIKDYWELYKFYILAALVVIGIIFLIVYYIKYGRKVKGSLKVLTNQTLKDLDRLKKKNYIQNGNYRMYYVELIDITREFLTKQYKIPANVLLTDDLIDYMKGSNVISEQNEKVIEEIFQRGDLVKFAKTIPNSDMMEKDFNDIKTMVQRSTKDVEAEQLRTMN